MFLSRSSTPFRSLLSRFSSSSSSQSTLTQESVLYTLKKLDKSPLKALSFFDSLKTEHSDFSPCSSAYNLMLRILCRRESLPHFWDLLKSMESTGQSMDEGTYQTLLANFKKEKLTDECTSLNLYHSKLKKDASTDDSVKSVANAVLSCEDFGKELKSTKFVLSEDMVVLVLRELRRSPLKALAFFNWVKDTESGYKHGSVSYNAMARVLGRDDSLEKFWDLVREMKQNGFDVDIDTYVKVLRQFLKRGLMKDGVELYELMMDGPYKPTVQDCAVLLRQISMSPVPDLDLVYRVVTKHESCGNPVTKPIYDGMHRSLTSNGQFKEAEEVVKKMKIDGYQPDNITYSQLVYGLCKANRLDDARKVLDEMAESGCTPDLKTWTVLIQGHCTCGEIDKALECLADMTERNLLPDGDLLDILVKAMCQATKQDAAHELFVEMVEKTGVKPWQASYKYLIKELLRTEMIKEAHGLAKSMKKHNFPPFWEPFGAHIAKFGMVEDAKELLKELSRNKNPAPNLYLELFKCFFEEGRCAEAQDLLYKCPRHIRKHGDIVKLFGTSKAESVA
ncbi:pentatricopeptide repeat (PPR) superfamily protein [Carex rostrata]